MASGALPPAFPAIRIDGELYWDGAFFNTPLEAVFDDNPRCGGLIFAVHLWRPEGPEPESIWNVMGRQKDLQYTSRAVIDIRRQRQLHKLRHIIEELAQKLPAEIRAALPEIAGMAAHGCTTRMHVLQLSGRLSVVRILLEISTLAPRASAPAGTRATQTRSARSWKCHGTGNSTGRRASSFMRCRASRVMEGDDVHRALAEC